MWQTKRWITEGRNTVQPRGDGMMVNEVIECSDSLWMFCHLQGY